MGVYVDYVLSADCTEEEMVNNRPTPDRVPADAMADEFPMHVAELHHGGGGERLCDRRG